jgi:hypothetical protein
MVLTAHNFFPHNRRMSVESSTTLVARRKAAIRFSPTPVLHARRCARDGRIHIIAHGDLAAPLGKPLPQQEARVQLQLPLDKKICLVFGMISRYKGSDELVRYWAQNRLPYRLVGIGAILSKSFTRTLHDLGQDCATVDLRLLHECLGDEALRLWLSASDCAIFNYREIFTSGAATFRGAQHRLSRAAGTRPCNTTL